jgi:molecular chaperone DnaK (HSP70)
MKQPAIGIDLGTTHSLAALFSEGKARLVDSADPLIPSVVAFPLDGAPLVGKQANAQASSMPERVVRSIKRLMGMGPADIPKPDLAYPFRLEEHLGLWTVALEGNRHVSPPEVSAHILRAILDRCQAQLGFRPERAVITVPAYFNDKQRLATRQAAEIIGLRVIRMINEPTAAALAYGLNHVQRGIAAVYDLGGGTFDLTLLEITDGVFRVLATHGDTALGGDDFDAAILAHLLELHGSQFSGLNAHEKHDWRSAARSMREELSDTRLASRKLGLHGRELDLQLDRETLEKLIAPFVERSLKAARKALRDAGLQAGDVDHVLLVGGATRTPLVSTRLAEFFGRAGRCEINPDHVVALGAAVQAALIDEPTADMLLLDVTPLSLGLETVGGAVSKLILRNTPVPAMAQETFTTFMDSQTGIDFHVVQGERELVEDNISLARFKLRGIPPMPAGLPLVRVRFLLDADGILTVEAEEQRSGQRAAVEVIPGHGLDLDGVRARVLESIDCARQDSAAIRLISARTKAQTLIMATRRALAQLDSLPAQRGEGWDQEIRQTLQAAESAAQGKDPVLLEQACERLNNATQPLAEELLGSAFLASSPELR